MEYNGIKFDAIVATPGCGKSYLCDKYPDKFVDVDEIWLRCKYEVPKDITRQELERTKGNRPYVRKPDNKQHVIDLEKALDEERKKGKVLIAAPHPEAVNYLVKNNIKFVFVYQAEDMKYEIERRMLQRGNIPKVVKEVTDQFEFFLEKNKNENQSVVHYKFGKDEYLEDIIKKFGYKF